MSPQQILAEAREIEKRNGRDAAIAYMTEWEAHEASQSWSYDDQYMRDMSALNADILSGMIKDF